MKNIFRLSIIAVAISVGATFVVLPVVRADSAPMDDAHANRIRANCLNAQATLNRLHASDALLRVNRGQLYESISNKLMATLNSRIALNQMDGSKLSQITATYNKDYTTFYNDYLVYEQQLSAALQIDCTKQPVAFYDAVNDARTKRNTFHSSVVELNKQLAAYSDAFNEFSAAYTAASKEVSAQ